MLISPCQLLGPFWGAQDQAMEFIWRGGCTSSRESQGGAFSLFGELKQHFFKLSYVKNMYQHGYKMHITLLEPTSNLTSTHLYFF